MKLQLDPGIDPASSTHALLTQLVGENQTLLETINEDKTIHEIRKNCKKARALLRLLQPGLHKSVYLKLDRHFRDIARSITQRRSATVTYALWNTFAETHQQQFSDSGIHEDVTENIRNELSQAMEKASLQDSLPIVLQQHSLLLDLVSVGDFSTITQKILRKGIRRSYKQTRRHFKILSASSTPKQMHEWRKRVKYLSYQLQFFSATKGIQPLTNDLKQIAERLGDHHDLHELCHAVKGALKHLDDTSESNHHSIAAMLEAEMDRVAAEVLKQASGMFKLPSRALTYKVFAHWQAS